MGALGDDVALSAFLSDWQPKFVGFMCRSTGLDLEYSIDVDFMTFGALRSKMPYKQVLVTGGVSERVCLNSDFVLA